MQANTSQFENAQQNLLQILEFTYSEIFTERAQNPSLELQH